MRFTYCEEFCAGCVWLRLVESRNISRVYLWPRLGRVDGRSHELVICARLSELGALLVNTGDQIRTRYLLPYDMPNLLALPVRGAHHLVFKQYHKRQRTTTGISSTMMITTSVKINCLIHCIIHYSIAT